MSFSRQAEKSAGWSRPLVLLVVAASFFGGSITTYLIQRHFQTSSAPGLSDGKQVSQDQQAPVPAIPAPPSSPAGPSLPEGPSPAAEAPGTSAPVSAPQASPAPAPPTDPLPARVEVRKGEGLAKVINTHYPGEYRMGLDVIVLANPGIDSANVIHPGQVINLPRIDFRARTVQLQDGLLYALYGSYYSAASWQGDKPWLEKSEVRFLVRVSRDAAGKTLHRVFLGGYETLEALREAQERLRLKSRHARLSPWDVGEKIAQPAGNANVAAAKAPAPPPEPAALQAPKESSPAVAGPPSATQLPVASAPPPPPVPQAAASAAATAAEPEEPALRRQADNDAGRLTGRMAAWAQALAERLASLTQFFRSSEADAVKASTEPAESTAAAPPPSLAVSESKPAAPPAAAPAPLAGLLKRQVVANKGESLTKVAIRNYGNRDKTILTALILANPEIDTENVIHPGQIINLPRVNLSEETVQLPDGLLYALYGRYYSAESWEGDKPWLEKDGVRFLVRVTQEATGRKIHRVFLGGYETLADLQAARQCLQAKSRHVRVRRPKTETPKVATSPGENQDDQEKPPAPAEELAAVEADSQRQDPAAPVESQSSPRRDYCQQGLNLAAPWLQSMTFRRPAVEFGPGQNPLEVMRPAKPRSAEPESPAPQISLATKTTAGETEPAEISPQEPVSATGAAQAPPALEDEVSLPPAIIRPPEPALPMVAASPEENLTDKAKSPAPAEELAAVEADSQRQDPAAPVESQTSPRRDPPQGGLNLAAPWLKDMTCTPLAAELDPGQNPLEVMPLAKPQSAEQEISAPQISLAAKTTTGETEPAENSPKGPASATGTAQAPPALEDEVSLPAAILPEATSALPFLKLKSDLTGSFKHYWDTRISFPPNLWPYVKSLLQSLVPAGALPAGKPEAQKEIRNGAERETTVLASAKEVLTGTDGPGLTPPGPVAPEQVWSTNIRRYLDAGGTFRIENRDPKDLNSRSLEPYVEPRPEALESFFKNQNEVPLPATNNAPDGRPLREVSWPGGAPSPLPTPDPKPPEKVLPPEGTIRRYRDAQGVLHVVNGELHNPGNPAEKILAAQVVPDHQAVAAGSNENRQPSGDQVNGGMPIQRVAFPGDENAPLTPPVSRPPERALPPPEELVRRYRDTKGVIHIVNREPKDPTPQGGTLLAESMPAGPLESPSQPLPPTDDRTNVRWPLRKVSLPEDEPALPAPPASRPPENALLAEGTIRRHRDAKGVLHIKSVEYPKPPPWPAAAWLAGNTPGQIPAIAPRSGEGAQSRLPLNLTVPQVVAFRDQKGRFQIRSLGPEDVGRKAALELNRASLDPIIVEAALTYRLPVPLIQAVIKVESNFTPWAVSPKGAMGLMQLMPGTAAFLGVTDPFCPRENIMGGCRYLRILLDGFNENLALTLAAYNAGYQRVIDAGFRVPEIKETQNFVTEVLSRYYTLVLANRPSKI